VDGDAAPRPAGPYDTTERDERIVVRDGTGLAAVIIEPVLPAGSPPQPCVVVTNGYSGLDFSLRPDLRLLAAHGYPVVLARLRGVPRPRGRPGCTSSTARTAMTSSSGRPGSRSATAGSARSGPRCWPSASGWPPGNGHPT